MSPPATSYLGLGSNVGDRTANLRQAVGLVAATPGISIDQVGGLYETEPVGVKDQPWFLNTVVRISTDLSPHDLLAVAKRVEATVGRTPTFRWGPREIDVDVLLYDEVRMSDATLTIPHPRIAERLFVLLPLRDVNPTWVDAAGVSIDDLIDHLRGTADIRPYPETLTL
ncbi:MAG: 2-amino-4-hydroxy-6-hydroxymethyldihydropteridine diphosphokinase [Actinobacteria bacterium]|nr:2-amino-4-hydroxy-6-hydroxymethyldihydropteridine diphosphokinase [Actinomycetota bacterium]